MNCIDGITVLEGPISIIYISTRHGSRSFSLRVTFDGGRIDFPIFIDATDVNNDDYLDILIVNMNGKGKFQTQITSFTGGA